MEKTKLISLKTSVKNAVKKLSENASLGFAIKGYAYGMLLVIAIALPLMVAGMALMGPSREDLGMVSPSLAFTIIAVLVGLGFTAFQTTLLALIPVKLHQGNIVPMKDLIKETISKAPKFMGLMIISSILVSIGYVLLIIPGIILSICFLFAPYILLSEDVGVIEALKKSRQITKGYKMALFGRGLLFLILMLVLSIPTFLLMYILGSLVATLLGFFSVLILMNFLDDLKGKVEGTAEEEIVENPVLPIIENEAPEIETEVPDSNEVTSVS